MPDLSQQIRERLNEWARETVIGFDAAWRDASARFEGRDPRDPMSLMCAAILSVLAKHPHFRARDGSNRHVDTLGYPYDFGCGKCHAWSPASTSLTGLGWCETVTDIASALGIEVDGE